LQHVEFNPITQQQIEERMNKIYDVTRGSGALSIQAGKAAMNVEAEPENNVLCKYRCTKPIYVAITAYGTTCIGFPISVGAELYLRSLHGLPWSEILAINNDLMYHPDCELYILMHFEKLYTE